jgi:hypothetical protein
MEGSTDHDIRGLAGCCRGLFVVEVTVGEWLGGCGGCWKEARGPIPVSVSFLQMACPAAFQQPAPSPPVSVLSC